MLIGSQVRLEPVDAGDVAELRRILATPEVRRWWGDEAASAGWPFDDPSTERFAVRHGGEIVGMIQCWEEVDPMYRHATIDIFLDPAVHGRGFGRDAVAALAAHLFEVRHHHRLSIDPAADNQAAVRCYTSVGFRPVGVLRQYERGPDGTWHDGLLMDLLVSEWTADLV